MIVEDVIRKFMELAEIDPSHNISEYVYLYNIVESELSTDYIKLYCTENFECTEKPYIEFKYKALLIKEAENKYYYVSPTALVSKNGKNLGKVTYAAIPNHKTYDDESSYPDRYLKILAFGMCAEFYLQLGMYEEAKEWNTKYKNQIVWMLRDRQRGINIE